MSWSLLSKSVRNNTYPEMELFNKNHKLFQMIEQSSETFSPNDYTIRNSTSSEKVKKGGMLWGNVPYFKIYFDISYYLCITPFRFRKSESLSETKEYVLHKNRFQRVICAVRHFLALWVRLTSLREQAVRRSISRVFYYFDITEAISLAVYYLIYMNIVWRMDAKIEELMKESLKYARQFQKDHYKKLNKALILCTIAGVISILSPILGYDVVNSAQKSVGHILQSYLQRGKFCLFLDQTPQLNTSGLNSEINFGRISFSDLIIILHQFIAQSSSQTFDFFASMSLLLSSIVLLEAASSFKKQFNSYDNRVSNFDKIIDQFHALKVLSAAINEFAGPIVFAYVMVSLLYFAVNLDELLVEPDYYRKFIVVYFLINDSSILFLSGQVCQEINAFKAWLLKREHRGILSPHEMTLLLADASSNPVAISGYGKFTIDNSFIGNVGVTLITLFVIVLQFKPNEM